MAKTPENNLTLFIRLFYEREFIFEGAAELYESYKEEVKDLCCGEASVVKKYNEILKQKHRELYS